MLYVGEGDGHASIGDAIAMTVTIGKPIIHAWLMREVAARSLDGGFERRTDNGLSRRSGVAPDKVAAYRPVQLLYMDVVLLRTLEASLFVAPDDLHC